MRERKKCDIINIRISDELKEESKTVLDLYDLKHSKAIRLFLEYVAKHKKLPFEIDNDN